MSITYPPGPKGSPILGNMGYLRGDRLKFLQDARRDYGDIVYIRMLSRHTYLLSHPDMIHQVLVRDAKHYHKTPLLKDNTRHIIGEGLLTSEDPLHKRQRRLTQPAFHVQRIATYADTMVDYTQRMLNGWQDGQQMDLHDAMMRLTMQIVAKTLFDADISEDAARLGHAITFSIEDATGRIMRPLHLPAWVPTPHNLHRSQQAQYLEKTMMSIITDRRLSGEDKGDLLSMLLLSVDEDGARMTDRQVRDEAMTLFIAGHETTANALSWTLYLLAQHPEVDEKLRAEIDSVLAGRPPTLDDLKRLPYTEQVVKEAMRLYPPAWIITRLPIDDVTIGGYKIRPDSILIMSPYVMHRHPGYWQEPEAFRPERFEEEDAIPRFVYLPFGGGPRVCIGNSFAMMEATLVLATLMQQASFDLLPGQDIRPEPLITLRPSPSIDVTVKLREKMPSMA